MDAPHPIHRLYQAEDLVRMRRSDEQRRYAASQRQGRIDPNPHIIDAVIFALRRVKEGGCILADEVGLGKTIEAGIIIAQLLAEGANRVLVVLPKALLGQWQNELYTLFGISAKEGGLGSSELDGKGVFLVGREFAGGERGSETIKKTEPFDLVVIDEAHEVFAGIYKRYDKFGVYQKESDEARTAHRLKTAIGPTPVLLLTATPVQNSLAELWGLVQYVEPTNTLLGNLNTFREVFCEPGSKDRRLVQEQTHELRRRINEVCQRTLRRQAQEFLETPFTNRRAMLFDYTMSKEEKSLYNDITEYLLEPELCAFSGSQRRLLLISFHRLMASSIAALEKSLGKVADRLRRQLDGELVTVKVDVLALDLEDEDLMPQDSTQANEEAVTHHPEKIKEELFRVEQFIERARQLTQDGKANSLLDAIRLVLQRGKSGEGSGKVVIFTESITTQNYIRDCLTKSTLGLTEQDITLFRGTNNSQRAGEALRNWNDEIGNKLSANKRPSKEVAVRLALVHEFRTRSRVFISTEAGAKGLNLQFCDTLINFDLPWNPQRIEQRIGRCHRYGQGRDVTVVNFLAKDNEAQRLTFRILSEKLDLFGQVLDASDVVLHEPTTNAPETFATAFGADLESRLNEIYDSARSQQELSEELQKLSGDMEKQRAAFEDAQERVETLIQTRFDDKVKQVFRRISDEVPQQLEELDLEMEGVLVSYLVANKIPFERSHAPDVDKRILYEIAACDRLPEGYRSGETLVIGNAKGMDDKVEPLHFGHALLSAAIDDARQACESLSQVSIKSEGHEQLRTLRGKAGRLVLLKTRYDGFEQLERLTPIAILDGDQDPLDEALASAILQQPIADHDQSLNTQIDDEDIDDAIEESIFVAQAEINQREQERFDRFMEQIDRYADDQAMVLRRHKTAKEQDLLKATKRWEESNSADARTRAENQRMKLEDEIEQLSKDIDRYEQREDKVYLQHRDRAHQRRFAKPTTRKILDVEFILQ